jgi:CxxC motif-containing protein
LRVNINHRRRTAKEGQLSDEQAKNLRVNTFINSATADSQIKQKQYEAENAQKQGKVLDSVAELNLTNKVQSQVQTQILRTELKYLPRKLQVEIQKDLSEISVNAANALLLGESRNLVCEQVRTQVEATLSAKTDNKIKKDTVKAVTDKIFYEAGVAGAQSERQQKENMLDFHDPIYYNMWRGRHGVTGK